MNQLYNITCVWCLLLFEVLAYAQPGSIDMDFHPVSGPNNKIEDIELQANGQIIAVGLFSSFNGSATWRIVRLNPDGSVDSTFSTGTGSNGIIKSVAIQPDGKIIAGGYFNQFNGRAIRGIVRLNLDGTTDTTFSTGSGFDDKVEAILVQPDGKIIVGGDFVSYNDTLAGNIIRMLPDGHIDTGFMSGVGFDGAVECLALQGDSILAGGSFTTYNGDYCFRLTRLKPNGLKDTGFNTIPGASSTVYKIHITSSGKIVIGGDFDFYEGQPKKKLLIVNNNGTIDGNLNIGAGFDQLVSDIESKHDTLIVVGNYSNYNQVAAPHIISILTTGIRVQNFNSGSGANGDIACVKRAPDGKILIGGSFLTFDSVPIARIARLYDCLTPSPDTIYGSNDASCNGTLLSYSVGYTANALRYEWTIPQGWIGHSDSSSITLVSNGNGGVLSVRAFTEECGYSNATALAIIHTQPDFVPICMVTVDSSSTHNVIIWEKPVTNTIDSFIIYREVSSGVYQPIGAVAYDSLSECHDYLANPNITSYRYKLGVRDTCGAFSVTTPFHSTIHLQNLGDGNFQWTFYQIENSLNPVLSFNVYRDNYSNGNYFPIGNVPGTNATFTDITFDSFSNSSYYVDVNWGKSCNPSRAVNTTRSNIKPKGIIVVGVDDSVSAHIEKMEQLIVAFPNPTHGDITAFIPASINPESIQLITSLGEELNIGVTKSSNERYLINTGILPPGSYVIVFKCLDGIYRKRIVVAK